MGVEEQAGGRSESLPPLPQSTFSIQAKGGSFASLLGKLFLTNHSSFDTTQQKQHGLTRGGCTDKPSWKPESLTV